MDEAIHTLIGMSIAYLASLFGMALAWRAWRRRAEAEDGGEHRSGPGDPVRGADGPRPGGGPPAEDRARGERPDPGEAT